MTHLEDLWNSFPSGRPPIGAILAEAKAPGGAGTGRRSLFAAVGTIAAGAIVATALTNVGAPTEPNTPLELTAFQADLKPASSCDDLLVAYKKRAMAKVTEWGWNQPYYYDGYKGAYAPLSGALITADLPGANRVLEDSLQSATIPMPQTAAGTFQLGTVRMPLQAPGPQGSPKLLTQGNSATGTNVQEIGVDEPDTVKTNGTLIARINGNTLAVFDASGDTIKPRGTIGLPYLDNGQILMSGDTVIASGYNSDPGASNGGTRVQTISLSNPDSPQITSNVVYAGGNVMALRQQGSVVRMVLSTGLPNLHFTHPTKKVTKEQALATNRHMIATSTFKDWIPTYDAGEGKKQLLPCRNVAVPPAGVPLGTTSIVSIDVAHPTTLNAVGVVGRLGTAYESLHNLYLTVGGNTGGCYWELCPRLDSNGSPYPATTILQFALDGTRTTHIATGQVQGVIQDSWSMDEWAGILRVVTTRFGPQPKPVTIHKGRYSYQQYVPRQHVNVVETLVPHDKQMVRQGVLTGLGANQTLTAARFFDNMAIISTANYVDPLYTIDLSDPAHPKQLGALHLPGQTQYIHPIASNRFLTISSQTRPDPASKNPHARIQFTQVAIFDVTDPAHVKQIDQVSAGENTWSLAWRDPKNFTWLPDKQTALTPFNAPKGMYLGVYNVNNGQDLTQAQIKLSGSYSGARTFEVANGKIVLISGGSVSFLHL